MPSDYITRAMEHPRILGIAGWSGSGKTTLLARLIPELAGRGLRIATLKHAHHEFDVDVPGKDSWRHRQAGATQVIVASARRWVSLHELRGAAEPTLAQLLRQVQGCDLVLVEGYKHSPHPKLEVYRAGLGKPALHPQDPAVLAVASDAPLPTAQPPCVPLDDIVAVADCVLALAQPLAQVLALLEVETQDSVSSEDKGTTRPGSAAE